MNIYVLQGQANQSFEGDNPAVLTSDIDWILVECDLDEASQLASEWGLLAPMLAKDGIHTGASGDEIYIANGEVVNDIETLAEALGYHEPDDDGYTAEDHYMDHEDFLRSINRIF